MSNTLREFVRPVVSGSHARRHGLKLLRRVCLVTLVAIAVQFSLGMILNLYVDIPAAEAHASWLRESSVRSEIVRRYDEDLFR